MNITTQRSIQDFWVELLNDQAVDLGLERAVKVVSQPEVGQAMQWAYETGSGELVSLGGSIEEAEASLRSMVGA